MTIVKLSWSSMNAWYQGRQEDAVAMYLGKGIPSTPAMELGSALHEKWEKEIKRTKKIPDELGGGDLIDPIVEEFFGVTLPFSDDYQIHTISRMDLIDKAQGIIWDWKTGLSTPGSYLGGNVTQHGLYQVTAKGNGISLKEGRFVCFNPYTKEHTVGVQYLDENTERNALEFIYTVGGEMINYLQTQKLIKNYDPDWKDKPATQKQISFIKSLGGEADTTMTKLMAKNQIDRLIKERDAAESK